jgi:hypothetical protein
MEWISSFAGKPRRAVGGLDVDREVGRPQAYSAAGTQKLVYKKS